MPIEVYIGLSQGNENTPDTKIKPGGYLSVPDFSSSGEKTLCAHCEEDDSGSVYLSDALVPGARRIGDTDHSYRHNKRLGSIGLGGVFERTIMNDRGKAIKLVFIQTPSIDQPARALDEA